MSTAESLEVIGFVGPLGDSPVGTRSAIAQTGDYYFHLGYSNPRTIGSEGFESQQKRGLVTQLPNPVPIEGVSPFKYSGDIPSDILLAAYAQQIDVRVSFIDIKMRDALYHLGSAGRGALSFNQNANVIYTTTSEGVVRRELTPFGAHYYWVGKDSEERVMRDEWSAGFCRAFDNRWTRAHLDGFTPQYFSEPAIQVAETAIQTAASRNQREMAAVRLFSAYGLVEPEDAVRQRYGTYPELNTPWDKFQSQVSEYKLIFGS